MPENQTKSPQLVAFSEETRLKRILLAWLNSWPGRPADVPRIEYETLPPDGTGMCLTTAAGRGAYIIRKWVTGGYEAAFDFILAYRVQPGESADARLRADEILDAAAEWFCAGPYPEMGEKCSISRVECVSRAAVSGEDRENGVEDHILTMKLNYTRKGEINA